MTDKDTKTYCDFEAAYGQMQELVEHYLSAAPSVIRKYTSHLTKSKGKFVRACALLTCAMDEEDRVCEEAVQLAAAVELLHLATLVHDDVIDDSDLRRGTETLQKKFGKKVAVICGDYLLSLALRIVTAIPYKDEYQKLDMPDYLSRICMGELLQEINNSNLELSVYRYLTIIRGKTAVMFEASFYGGAVFATKDKKELQLYKRIGSYVGMIFQLMDDCIDYEANQSDAKKNVRSDYEEGVITLPLIHAMEENGNFYSKVKQQELGAEAVYDEVLKAGGTDYTRKLAGRYYKKALGAMEKLAMSEAKKSRMMAVLDKSFFGITKNHISN